MSINEISSIRTTRINKMIALFLLCLTCILFIPATSVAEAGEVVLTVRQICQKTGAYVPPSETFSYRLTRLEPDNPMPAGSGTSGYAFTLTGTKTGQLAPIKFTKPGVYHYEICCFGAAPQHECDCDDNVFTLEIIVESDLTATTIVHNEEGSKVASILYEHVFDPLNLPTDPSLMVDPPVVKTVSGNPSAASVFTFQLKAGNPSNPMPTGGANGVKTVQVRGSGSTEFGTWPYTAEGTYYYTISEVNSGSSDYTYDTTVYTITDTVIAENGQLKLSRVVTNNANRPVTSCSFINTYKGGSTNPGGGNPGGGTTTDPGKGPKTGDDSETTLYMILFCAAGVTALGSAGYLLAGRRRREAAE